MLKPRTLKVFALLVAAYLLLLLPGVFYPGYGPAEWRRRAFAVLAWLLAFWCVAWLLAGIPGRTRG